MNAFTEFPIDPPLLMDHLKVRALRARIYGECTDGNWLACRDAWLGDIDWLLEHAALRLPSSVLRPPSPPPQPMQP